MKQSSRWSIAQSSRSVVEQLESRNLFAVGVGATESLVGAGSPAIVSALEAEAVATPTFDHARGFYESAFDLTLATATPGAEIRYTLDGSTPTETFGTVYTGAPIPITTTTIVRAVAYKLDATTSASMSHSYLFLADVIKQGKTIPGKPNPILPLVGGPREFDYEMDPAIVDSATYKDRLIPALKSIPTMSIAVPQEDMWDNGFYDTQDVEVAMSMEFIDPAHPEQTTQANAGIEAHGDDTHKRSLRVTFKKDYGPGKFDWNLFRDAPTNSETSANEVDQFVLRAGSNRSWSATNYNRRTTFTEDEFGRSTQLAISGEGLHGTFVHLYINGAYFGLYNMVERPNDGWGEIYYGGKDDDWFSANEEGVKEGDGARWKYLLDTVAPQDMAVSANYELMKQYLDVENFSDYLIEQFYHRVVDWPLKNWWVGGDTKSAMPLKIFAWDTEYQFNMGAGQIADGAWVHPDFRVTATSNANSPLIKLWRSAMKSPEFRQTFVDRVSRAVAGPLSDSAVLSRLNALNGFISEAVIAESARWGDLLMSGGNARRTRDVDWVNATNEVLSQIPGNADQLLAALRQQGYYPSLNPAQISSPGGIVEAGTVIHVTNPNATGVIYYTLDGSDPRLAGGAINPAAIAYDAATGITLNAAAKLRVRVLAAGVWSGATEADFAVNTITKLRFSELYYHPKAPADSVIDKDEYEFLELINTSNVLLNLSGVQIGGGVDFTFGDIDLPAGGRTVVVRNLEAFQSVYGTGINVAGVYSGKLDNAGELLTLTSPGNVSLASFTYDDDWYKSTDGSGVALVVVDPTADPAALNTAAAWQAGVPVGGTPGAAEPAGNQKPVVNAGASQEVTIGTDANLSGTVSDDKLPVDAVVTTEWSLVSGPGDVTFGDATQLITTASFTAIGTYVLRLTATDTELTSTSDVTIEVKAVIVPGALRGFAFDDADENGSFDNADVGAAGVTVFLDANGNGALDTGEASVVSEADGSFAFLDLLPGSYKVRRLYADGFMASTLPVDVTLESGGELIGLNLGSKAVPPPPPATIAGVAFDDLNTSGTYDAGDAMLAGATVYIDQNANDTFDTGEPTTLTVSGGMFAFDGLAAGTYAVRRVLPSGYTYSTSPINVTLVAGQNYTGANIGVKPIVVTPPADVTLQSELATLSGGTVKSTTHAGYTGTGFADYAGQNSAVVYGVSRSAAQKSKLEFRYANGSTANRPLQVYVNDVLAGTLNFAPTGGWTKWATTTLAGVQIPAGSVTIRVVASTSAGGANVDSLAIKADTTVVPPPPPPSAGSVGGFLFWDTNKNAKYDTGDTYQSGKVVFIDLDGDNVLDSNEKKLTTDSQGKFNFTGLAAGTYQIRRVVPKGYKVTTPAQNVTITAGQVFSTVAIGTINA